jgi:hypothetical protein
MAESARAGRPYESKAWRTILREGRLAATWTFIMAGVRTRALTASRPIKPTSPRCHSARQPNPGRGSTYRRGKSVQTTGATSAAREMSDWLLDYLSLEQ